MLNSCKNIVTHRSPPYWWKFIVSTFVILVLFASITCISGKSRDDSGDGKSHLKTNPEWSRKKSKSSECRLGGNRFPLNSTWSPDLGPPFGVWKCVKCTCTPIQKKKRIVAKVICNNIKNECPDAKCTNPVLAPGSCCKRCPGDPGFIEDLPNEDPEVENSSEKDFAVFLNGRTSLTPVTTHRLATGRVFLRRGTLHFSFVLGGSTPAPTMIQFMSEDGKILEELEAQPTPYEVNSGRICGTWTRVPRQYRTILLKEKLWVALIPPNEEDIISGRIARYKGVDTEVFSSLLSPVNTNQTLLGGGTAIISVSASSDSLHVSLVFNGIFKSSDARNVSIFVELRPSRQLDPVTDSIVLSKVFSDINEAQVMTTLGETSLRLLARGKVSMRVWSAESPDLALEGPIISRATCNVFHSVITSSPETNLVTPTSPMSYGAGWGIMYLLNDGDFEYQMKLEGLPQVVEKVTLQMNSKKKVRDLEDITASYKDGWVNGTYGKPTFRDLDSLLRGRLQVTINLSDGRFLSGIFETISVTEALRAFHPSLLMSTTSWMAANTWVAVDEDCVMHYDIYLAGEDPSGNFDPTWVLQLRENDTSWDPRLDLVNVTLEHTISGREVAAHTTLLSKVTLSRLHAGVTYLDLTVISQGHLLTVTNVTLTGILHNIRVSPFCLLYDDGEGSIKDTKSPDSQFQVDAPCKGFICLDEEVKPIVSKKCIDDEKIVYEDGSTWKSPINNCAKCMCTLGRIKCQDEPCVKPSCPNAILLPGQCCSSCPVVSGSMSERVCEMDNDLHIIGSFWHPFLAPSGFDSCVTCYCNITHNGTPVVECSRMSCPPLTCLDSQANFNGDSCCPKCPTTTPPPRSLFSLPPSVVKGMVNEGELEMSDEKKKEIILADGGCLERKVRPQSVFYNIPRANGDVWYPMLSPNGVPRCIACNCKDGNITCVSENCPETECKKGNRCHKKKGNTSKTKKPSPKVKLHRKRKNRRKKKEWFE